MTAGEQLQHYLDRFFSLRQHGDDALFLERLRRLHTVLEKLLEEISYDADSLATQYHDKPLVLDAEAVDRYLGELADDEDLSRYIL